MWSGDRDLPTGRGLPQAHGCPTCGAAPLTQVEDCESVHWLCQSCGRCWQLGVSGLKHTDPVACPGCASQGKAACFEVLRSDFPRFGPELEG